MGLVMAVLLVGLSGCAGLFASETERPRTEPRDVPNEPSAGEQAMVMVSEPELQPEEPLALADLLGDDGRLSVLILGTDLRKDIIGERTDAIIVATIHPDTGKVAMVSMPRDTVNVPIGPGRVHADRINTLYWDFQRTSKQPKAALRKTRKAFEFAFGTEIDFYALVEFNGLVRLIDSIGGIDVTLEKTLRDPTMHLSPKGLKLRAGDRHLNGKKTLAFSRSRHADSDYQRSRRQQQILTATVEQVRQRGLAALPALVALVGKKVVTDFPMEAAPLLLDLAAGARLTSPKSVVLAPSRFAKPGSQVYTIAPKVVEVRKMFDRAFRPID
jgi:LCP family protein required for cell wall assembly